MRLLGAVATYITIIYTRRGQTFSTEGQIDNFVATGDCIYYICLLQLQFTFQNMN